MLFFSFLMYVVHANVIIFIILQFRAFTIIYYYLDVKNVKYDDHRTKFLR